MHPGTKCAVYIHFWTGGIEMKYLKIRWISSYQRKPRLSKDLKLYIVVVL